MDHKQEDQNLPTIKGVGRQQQAASGSGKGIQYSGDEEPGMTALNWEIANKLQQHALPSLLLVT